MGLILWAAMGLMQRGMSPTVDPVTYRSPSGRFALHIDPTDPQGQGPADYRLTDGKTVRWSRRLPFTLVKAVIADDGRAAGYGREYTPNRNNFVVAILDPQGKPLRNERHPIQGSRFLHTNGDPKASGVILDPANDRILLQIVDPDVNRNEETWWSYRLSTSQPLPPIHPRPPKSANRFIVVAAPLPQTPLTLVHWWKHDDSAGATFALLDPSGNEVWSLDKGGDYEVSQSETARDAIFDQVWQGGGVLSLGPGPRFSLRFFKEGKRAAFAVDRAGNSWQVRETSVTAFSAPKPPNKPVPRPVRTVQLRPMAKLTVPLRKEAPSPIRDIRSFVPMDRGRVAVLRGGTNRAVVIADEKGKALRTIPLSLRTGKDEEELILAWGGSDRLMVFQAQNNTTWGWRVDAQTGQVSPFPQPLTPGFRKIAGFPDGSFAVLARENSRYTMEDELARYDANGRLLWRKRENGYGGKPEELLSPHDLAVDPRGNVVVLDNTTPKLLTFDPRGRFLNSVAISPEPSYPTNLAINKKGRIVVFNSGETQPLLYLQSNGRSEAPAQAPLDSGGKRITHASDLRLDAQNRVWISSCKSIFRLNGSGRTNLVLGQIPIDRGLREISSLHVSPAGIVYATEIDSKEVSVFKPNGRLRFIARPASNDRNEREGTPFVKELEVTPSGDFYLHWGARNGLLKFTPQGRRVGFVPYGNGKGQPLNQVPKPDWRWQSHQLVDAKGKVVARLDRCPNRAWMLEGPSAVAPNGALVAIEEPPYRRRKNAPPERIAWFSPSGQPQGMAIVPPGIGHWYQTPAFDGRLVYLVTEGTLSALNRKGEIAWRFPLPNKDLAYSVFPSRGGIALFDGVETVTWYKLP